MEPLKEFSSTKLTLYNCVIPEDRLRNTPSSKDGMCHDTEIDLRIKGCECIQSAGLLLKLPQAAMATAQVLLHRFYYAKSFVKFNFYYTAMACLFLAAKIEENNKRLRDVLNVFHHLRQKRKGSSIVPMDYVGEEYYRMRNTVNKYERYVLKLVITCLQLLELEKNKPLVQKAWNLMNDGLRTNIFVRFRIETVACACIFLAARQLQIPLPQNPSWWKLFDVRLKDMKLVGIELLALYKRPMKTLDELEKQVEILKENLMTQKKVEVKEITINSRTEGDTPPSQNASPSSQSPSFLSVQSNKLSGVSPGSKPGVSPLVDSVQKSSQNEEKSSLESEERSPVNGHKRDRSHSGTPPPISEKRPKLLSVDSRGSQKHHKSPRRRTPEAYKPIISPIKISSDSHSDESSSPPIEDLRLSNGIQSHYSVDRTYDVELSHESRRHRHKHRSSEKHRHHHNRDRSRSRERVHDHKHSRHHRQERAYHREVTRNISLTSKSREKEKDYARLRKADSYYR